MNCCNDFGHCTQGAHCAARTSMGGMRSMGRITAAETAEAARLMDNARLQARRFVQTPLPKPVTPPNPPAPVGQRSSVWFVDSEFSPPEERRQAHTHSCDQLGMCMGRADCACPDSLALYSQLPASAVPAEAGNVQIPVDPYRLQDDADDWRPLSTRERLGLGLTFAVFGLAWLVLVGMALGYGWERWAGAWAYEVSRAIFGGLLS